MILVTCAGDYKYTRTTCAFDQVSKTNPRMPKKNSAWGVNTKAAEANERKTEKKRQEQDQKEKAVEDSKWRDDNKLDQKKKDRKDMEQQKKADALSRKQESKLLLEQEEQTSSSKVVPGTASKKGGKKVTLSDIDKIKEVERKKQEQRNLARQKEKRNITEAPELEMENPNRKMADMLAEENAVEARSVEDALSLLNVEGDTPVDKHPEKRMKAAYNEFEQRELPQLKIENPSLKLSQLKHMLHKQWQKHPDNPMNR